MVSPWGPKELEKMRGEEQLIVGMEKFMGQAVSISRLGKACSKLQRLHTVNNSE
jgi:hypothetical protein